MSWARGASPRAVFCAAAIAVVVAGLGGLATDLGPWYYGLKQPPWKPPDAAFGPVWTTIFALTAWAGLRAWQAAPPERQARLLGAYLANGVLNVLWSLLFFTWKRPDWALAEVVLLWLSIVALIGINSRLDRLATLLLAPYLLWVSFAAVLNAAVVKLNAPF